MRRRESERLRAFCTPSVIVDEWYGVVVVEVEVELVVVEEKGVDAIGAVVDRVNESRSLVRLAPPRP